MLSINFTNLGAGWGGIAFDFGNKNISDYSKFVIHINKTAMPSLTQFGIKFEDNSGGNTQVDISSYTPTLSGDWLRYEIPLAHFPAVNLNQLRFIGLWNPQNSSSVPLFGMLYIDNIYLMN